MPLCHLMTESSTRIGMPLCDTNKVFLEHTIDPIPGGHFWKKNHVSGSDSQICTSAISLSQYVGAVMKSSCGVTTWIQVLTLPLTGCVIMVLHCLTSLNFSFQVGKIQLTGPVFQSVILRIK